MDMVMSGATSHDDFGDLGFKVTWDRRHADYVFAHTTYCIYIHQAIMISTCYFKSYS